MSKKDYIQPTMRVVKLQHRSHILAGSPLQSVHSSGLNSGSSEELQYDDRGGDQSNAW